MYMYKNQIHLFSPDQTRPGSSSMSLTYIADREERISRRPRQDRYYSSNFRRNAE